MPYTTTLTLNTLGVLDVLVEHEGEWMHGGAVAAACGIPKPTVYQILVRLWQAGWLDVQREPRFTRYMVKPDRVGAARTAVMSLSSQDQP